jgi:hypothetical protein
VTAPERQSRPVAPGPASTSYSAASLREVADNLTQLQRRVVLEAIQTAEAWHWDRLADEFEAARPVPDEFHGRATRADLSRRWCDLTELAAACRARGEMARRGVDEDELGDLYEQAVEDLAC